MTGAVPDGKPESGVGVTLCVLLWAREGQADRLVAYEDRVLGLMAEHGGQVLHRVRSAGGGDEPFEVQLLAFASDVALDGYLQDDRRTALADERDAVVAATQVIRVEVVS